MKISQWHAIITRLITILAILLLSPYAVRGAAVDIARDAYYINDQGVEVVKGWEQCGGYEYSGPTQCEEGYSCRRQHPTYHQCMPATKSDLTPTMNLGVPTRPPDASPEPTTPFLPPRTTMTKADVAGL